MSKLVIVDGNAIIHRAYHALPPMTAKNGRMVNAVYGFASMLLKVWRELKPEYIAVTFDMAGPTFRHEKFKAYKATRVKADQALYDQIPLVHELVEAFNFPIYEKQGYEADDVIGTIVSKVVRLQTSDFSHKVTSQKSPKSEVRSPEAYIVTGDMDTLQLVGDNVKVYTLRKGLSDVVIYDAEEVKKRFGFGPEMMVDYKALRGDASDNIPGVPGIGEKTATELIVKIGGVDEIYTQVKSQKSKVKSQFSAGVIKKLENGEDNAIISRELAQIECNVPDVKFKLEDCAVKNFDRAKVVELFHKFEFVSLLKRVPGLERTSDFRPQASDFTGTTKRPKTEDRRLKTEFNFTEVKDEKEVRDLIKLIQEAKSFACRAVTGGGDVFTSELRGLVLVVQNHGFLAPAKLVSEIMPVFADDKLELIGHDLKQVVKAIARHCHPERSEGSLNAGSGNKQTIRDSSAAPQNDNRIIAENRLFDTMIASYLLNPGSRAHDISSIIFKTLGKELAAGSGQESLFGVDFKNLAHELRLILQAAEKLKKELIKANNLGLFEKIEMPLIPVLAEMELNGIAVDANKLHELSTRVSRQIKDVSAKVFKHAGQEFNISSPIQLREILFEKLEIPVEGIKKGKTGLSTGAEQLEKMRGLHPIIDEIEAYRELTKLQNTYIDVLPALINKATGRIHTSFNQAVAATGRLSSSDPNLQNIPIRTELGREIREAFIAEPGNILISADYSQIELRIVASLAEDKRMLEIFAAGEDIHLATAAAINNVPLAKVTKDMRRAAKEINFGVLYGMGTYGLSWRAEIPHWEAKAFIEKYFREFSGVKKYIDRTLEFTKKEGYCETLFGRRRYIPELTSSNYQLRAAAERMAVNHPIQGTAADLMKMAMIKVSSRIRSELSESKANVKMILQVHDELVFEVKKGLEKEIGNIIKETMEGVAKLRVPIEVHVSVGRSWGRMEKM